MKVCTKCGVEKSFDEFHKNKISKSGYRSWCKECMRLKKLELKKNPLMQLEKQIRSSIILENKILLRDGKKLCSNCKEIFLIKDLIGTFICKECNSIKGKEYRENNKGKIKEYKKEYNQKNKEKIKEHQKEYNREFYKKNKEKIKEIRKEYMSEYKKRNKEKINEKNREYRLKKKLEKLQNNDTQT